MTQNLVFYSPRENRSRPGIRLAMGFFFALVAGMVFKDFLAHSYVVLDDYRNAENILFIVSVAGFLLLQLIDGYLYYQYFEFSPLAAERTSWSAYVGFLVDNAVEAGILFFCYGAVHETDPKLILPRSAYFSGEAMSSFFFNVAAVEFVWFLWDFTYIIRCSPSSRPLSVLKNVATSKDTGIAITRRWTMLNCFWGVLMGSAWKFLVKHGSPHSRRISASMAILIMVYVLSYLILMKRYYSGEIAMEGDGAAHVP
jgi:hypothetical protein